MTITKDSNSLHKLSISDEVLKLDGFELKGVSSYGLICNPPEPPFITMKVYLGGLEVQTV